MNKLLFLIAGIITFVSCMDKIGSDIDSQKEEESRQEWEAAIGTINDQQTWNMAQTAKVSVTGFAVGTLKIYTAYPNTSGSFLLASTPVDKAPSLIVDVPLSSQIVYVQIENGSEILYSGYIPLENGTIRLPQSARLASHTRGGGCPTSIGRIIESKGSTWDVNWTNPENPYDHNRPWNVNFNVLENVTTEKGDIWLKEDYIDLVGPNGIFAERNNNLVKWEEKLSNDVTYKMKNEGPVTLSYNYGCTGNDNMFGYFYWKDGEDPLQAPLYVLIESARPSTNITKDGSPVGDMELGYQLEYAANGTQIQGTRYSLVYFDESGKSSYNFPAEMNIGFFLVNKRTAGTEANYYNALYYSVQEFNHILNGNGKVKVQSAVTFNYGNTTFIGFEDEPVWGDQDMNDIMFFASGDFEKPEDIDPDKSEVPMVWTLAFEDQGSKGDYDFNDVVIYVNHIAGETAASVDLCATGGTIKTEVYYKNQRLCEVHEAFGVEVGKMVNTSSVSKQKVNYKIEVPSDFTISKEGSDFDIRVYVGSSYRVSKLPSESGKEPQAILIPGKWRWPSEWISISEAYPEFGAWGANYLSDTQWYLNPVEEKVLTFEK